MKKSPVRRLRVLLVDNSPAMRTMYSRVLAVDTGIELVGETGDVARAKEILRDEKPDVLILDLHLPLVDPIKFLGELLKVAPVRTLGVCSSQARDEALTASALAAGALDVFRYPAFNAGAALQFLRDELVKRVQAVARMAPLKLATPAKPAAASGGASAGVFGATNATNSIAKTPRAVEQILAIASSTGGTEALKEILPRWSADIPATVIVQHMLPVFTSTFAQSLSQVCAFEVREAKDGDYLEDGLALIAPGDQHMEIVKAGAFFRIRLHQQPQLHGVRPAADYLMKSVAKYAGAKSIGLVLTGMGKDGAEGLLAMKKAGAFTIAQDEKSSIVWGMPKEAIDKGAATKILSLDAIAVELTRHFKRPAA